MRAQIDDDPAGTNLLPVGFRFHLTTKDARLGVHIYTCFATFVVLEDLPAPKEFPARSQISFAHLG